MAKATVRVRLIKTYEVFCDGTTEEEVLDNIADYERHSDEILSDAYEGMELVSAEFDEPEEEEESESETS